EIIESGSCYCSQLALAMAAITTAADYPTVTVHLSDTPERVATHVVVQVYYDDAWHLFDPTWGLVFRDAHGDIADYRNIRLHPALIDRSAFEGIKPETVEQIMRWMPQAYASGLHQMYAEVKSEYCPSTGHHADGSLRHAE